MKKEVIGFIYRAITAFFALAISDFIAQKFFDNGFWWQLLILFVLTVLYSPIHIKILKVIDEKFSKND